MCEAIWLAIQKRREVNGKKLPQPKPVTAK